MTNMTYALPRRITQAGKQRRIGIEIEFAGLDERRVASVLSERLGGQVSGGDHQRVTLDNSAIGDIAVELDIALRTRPDTSLKLEGMELARTLIPVEIVTAPLVTEDIAKLDAVLNDLREAGAQGSGQGLFFGFGVHLNPEITGANDPFTARTIRAYALVEEWLRISGDLDTTRRLLPFVDRWPFGLIDDLTRHSPESLDEIMDIYAAHTDSRNHGLDLLPLFRDLAPDRFDVLFGNGKGGTVQPRPTFHFRLPDSRIDEPDWSLAHAFAQWRLVEQVADDPQMLQTLALAWQEHRQTWLGTRSDWGLRVGAILDQTATPEAQPV